MLRSTLVILVLIIALAGGCIPIMIAGSGIVAGYSLSNDAATGEVKAEYRILWDVCMEKLEAMEAYVVESDESKGLIKAKVLENDVTIKINTISSSNQRLKVSARRLLLPKPQFAQKLFFKIIEDL